MDDDAGFLNDVLLNPLVWGGLFFYFVPTMIAVCRKSGGAAGVFFVNLFFGWSGVGMLLAYVLAFATPTGAELAYRQKVRRARDEFYLREAEKAKVH